MNTDCRPQQPGEGHNGHTEQIDRIIGDVIERRAAGQVVTDDAILARFPELAIPLREELLALREVHLAMLAAKRAMSKTDPSSEAADAVGDTAVENRQPHVPCYTILRELGRGAQAVVYVAVQESTGRKVALKLIGGGATVGMHDRYRFNREADVLAAVDHPHVVKVVDRGRTEDGSLFFAMDFVEGPALNEWLLDRRTRSSAYERDVAAIFAKIARALHEVHERGVVHRDLKPTNVRVDRLDEPHVLDFGLARLLTPLGLPLRTVDSGPEHYATVTGQIVGSLPWASPEQATGDTAKVDARSDVYSLGVMLYHAIAGEFPYPVDVYARQVLQNIITRKPAMPIRLSYQKFRRCDRVLEAIVLRAIAKERSGRYQSAAEFSKDLEAWLAGSPVEADERRSHQRAIVLRGIVVGIILLTGTITVGWIMTRPTPPVVFERQAFTNSVGIRLIQLSPASIRIGSPETETGRIFDEEQAIVRIEQPFWMGATEITWEQYMAVMGQVPQLLRQRGMTAVLQSPRLPVTGATWEEATEFCRRLSATEGKTYRLPSEAEWEYAARAGKPGPFSGSGTINEMGWYAGNSGGTLHEVGTKWPNHLGFQDVHGNAAEWCADAYRTFHRLDASGSQTMPADFQGRAIRGGHAQSPAEDCRSARREKAVADWSDPFVGFRIVMVDPSSAAAPGFLKSPSAAPRKGR